MIRKTKQIKIIPRGVELNKDIGRSINDGIEGFLTQMNDISTGLVEKKEEIR
jgi:hypothetical protein